MLQIRVIWFHHTFVYAHSCKYCLTYPLRDLFVGILWREIFVEGFGGMAHRRFHYAGFCMIHAWLPRNSALGQRQFSFRFVAGHLIESPEHNRNRAAISGLAHALLHPWAAFVQLAIACWRFVCCSVSPNAARYSHLERV